MRVRRLASLAFSIAVLAVLAFWWEVVQNQRTFLALTIVIGCVAAEMVWSRVSGSKAHRFSGTIDNFSVGIVVTALSIVQPLFDFAIYVAVFDRWRVAELPSNSSWSLAVALIGYDLTFYWAHRASHRINLLWAAHVVHHQSEDFNLSVGARVTLHSIFYFWFHLPLALLGVPPVLYLTAVAIHQLWQFTSHARILKNLGPIERLLITPASHSVHHACNDEYLDKNFGGLFSVWDQLFGTFVAFDPKIEARYGTVRGIRSWNPVSAVFTPWLELLRLSLQSRSVAELRRVWLGTPDDLNARIARKGRRERHRQRVRRGWTLYWLFQTIPAVLTMAFLMLDQRFLSKETQIAICAFIAVTLGCLGCLLDGARWASVIEPLRLSALSVLPASIPVVPFLYPRLFGLSATNSAIWVATSACIAFALVSLIGFHHLQSAEDPAFNWKMGAARSSMSTHSKRKRA